MSYPLFLSYYRECPDEATVLVESLELFQLESKVVQLKESDDFATLLMDQLEKEGRDLFFLDPSTKLIAPPRLLNTIECDVAGVVHCSVSKKWIFPEQVFDLLNSDPNLMKQVLKWIKKGGIPANFIEAGYAPFTLFTLSKLFKLPNLSFELMPGSLYLKQGEKAKEFLELWKTNELIEVLARLKKEMVFLPLPCQYYLFSELTGPYKDGILIRE